MAKTQQEIYAEKYRAGTLTQAERNTLLNAWKTLWVEETQKRLQSQVAPATGTNPQTPVTQQATPQVSTVPQPTVQTPVVQPVTPPVTETPKVEAPKTPTVETPPTPITKDTSWNDIKDKNLSSLEQLVEARYGTVATQQNGKLTGQINGKNYEWAIDAQGNPVKTEVQLTETDKFKNKLAQRLQTATPDELYNALVSGKVPEDLKEALMMNPNYIEAQQKFAKKKSADSTNNIVGWMYNTMSGVQTEETDKVAELGTKKADELLAKGKTEQELVSYRDFIAQDTELTDSVSQLSNVSRQYSELKRTAEDNLKRIVDENPWLSKASAMLLSAKQNEYVYNQMDALSDEMAILQANIDYRTNLLDKDYEQMLVQEQRAYQESLMAEERAFAQAQTAEERKYQEELQARQLEQKYAFEYGDLNSEDPTLQNIAIERAVAGMYENYPLPWMESQATKVQKVKQLMAQGMTGTQAIAQVESEIRNSQRYKDYIASEQRALQPETTGVNLWVSWGMQDPNSIASFSMQRRWRENLQCWELVNDFILQATWANPSIRFWDTLDSKLWALKAIGESDTPVEWGVFVSNPLWNNIGHVGIVQAVYGDGSIEVLEANASGKKQWEAPVLKTYTAEEAKNMSFSQSVSWQSTWYSQDRIELLAEISQIQSETEKRKALESAGLSLQDLTRYKADASAGRIPPTEAQKQSALGIISNIQGIAETDWTDAVGKWDVSRLTWSPDATDAGVLIENIRDVASFNNLWMLKWPMSDKDIAFLKSVSSKLDPTQGNKQFEKNIVEMYNVAARKAGIPEINKLSEIPKERILPWVSTTQKTGNTGASIWPWTTVINYNWFSLPK